MIINERNKTIVLESESSSRSFYKEDVSVVYSKDNDVATLLYANDLSPILTVEQGDNHVFYDLAGNEKTYNSVQEAAAILSDFVGGPIGGSKGGIFVSDWSTVVRVDDNYSYETHTLSGPETWTADLSGAIIMGGEVRTVVGDGSVITLDGPFSVDSITIPAGEARSIVMSWTGNQILVVLHDVENIEDTFPPVLTDAEIGNINGKTIVLTFNEDCDQSAAPVVSAFYVEGIASNPSIASTVWNSARELYVVLSDDAAEGESPKISYTKPDATGNPIKDINGNKANSWTAREVTNNIVSWTPADLGVKLLDWWDGTIVEDDASDNVTKWADQKGSIDWVPGVSPAYDDANKLIDFDSVNSEYLQSDANVGQIDRSTGQYWMVFDYTEGDSHIFICKSTSTEDGGYFMIQILSTGIIRVIANKTSGDTTFAWQLNDPIPSGKYIVSIKWDGNNFTIKVNNIVKPGYYDIGTSGGWEDYPTVTENRLSINAWRRTSDSFADTVIHEMHRTDGTLTEEEETNNYNYLNGKY